MEGTKEVGMAISDFGAGGRICQDVRDVIQLFSTSGALVRIGYMGHEPMHWQDAGGLSLSGGLLSEYKITM